jgi:hypothetical protein
VFAERRTVIGSDDEHGVLPLPGYLASKRLISVSTRCTASHVVRRLRDHVAGKAVRYGADLRGREPEAEVTQQPLHARTGERDMRANAANGGVASPAVTNSFSVCGCAFTTFSAAGTGPTLNSVSVPRFAPRSRRTCDHQTDNDPT